MIEKDILDLENSGNNKHSQNDDAYFRSIIENNSFYIIKTDLEGNYSYLNPFFCKMLSVTPEEYLGKNSLSLIMPEDHTICIETVALCFAEPDQSHWVILRKPVPNGVLFTQWEFKILKDESGNPVEFLCLGHDITPLILKQEELRNMVDVAAEQNKRLVNFTYIISHNIRSHVANILGILNISQELANHEMALGLIQESTTSLNEILSNLNEIISIQAHTSLPIVEINVFEQINRIVQSIQILLNKAGTEIEYRFEKDEVMQTNPAYFESIMLNLITNAVKYKSADRALQI
ncbi:PAS domain S-box protein [Dyadobacter sp. 3J3]|uniref:PAS domain-containing sensor histidine kinase n=1 Tax=Dyadobacter sp. 3J3 TaxID=2606600 RepID=UPI00135884BD|nr:PAS domain S-box protein [Dyadobacter sp. 3J3]